MLISSAGVGDPGFLIGPRAALTSVVTKWSPSHWLKPISSPLLKASCRALTVTKSFLPSVLGLFHGGDDGAGRSVAHPAAVEQPQRMGDDRGGHDLFHGHGLPQVGLGVEDAVGVALGRNMGQRPFQFLVRRCGIWPRRRWPVGQRPRGPRCWGTTASSGSPKPGTRIGQPAVAGVLELLHTHGQADVVGPGGHGIDRPPERLGSAGAKVFRPGDRDKGQTEGHW